MKKTPQIHTKREGEILLYHTQDGQVRLDVRFTHDTICPLF